MNFDYIEILNYSFLGNSVKAYLIAFAVFVFAIIFLKIFKQIAIRKMEKIAEKTNIEIDDLVIDIIKSIKWGFYLLLSLYLALKFIYLPEILEKVISYIIFAVLVYYIVKAIQKVIDYGLKKILDKTGENGQEKLFDPSNIKLLSKALKVILWLVAVILILQNFGYNVSALLAGLGIGGIAIAFALQNILGDIFASFCIFLDKPFQVGDFIIVGADMGTVKKIGIKSTRIQTLQGEEMIISNKELTNARINNYKTMEKRRIVFKIGVTYDTPTEKLRKIPEIIKKAIDSVEQAEVDRVHFRYFGDSSLDFESVYYFNNNDYQTHLDSQQKINLTIKEEFEKEGIEFAYPTQTLFVNNSKQ
jgi:small-conductance mechanosensitive channel